MVVTRLNRLVYSVVGTWLKVFVFSWARKVWFWQDVFARRRTAFCRRGDGRWPLLPPHFFIACIYTHILFGTPIITRSIFEQVIYSLHLTLLHQLGSKNECSSSSSGIQCFQRTGAGSGTFGQRLGRSNRVHCMYSSSRVDGSSTHLLLPLCRSLPPPRPTQAT